MEFKGMGSEQLQENNLKWIDTIVLTPSIDTMSQLASYVETRYEKYWKLCK